MTKQSEQPENRRKPIPEASAPWLPVEYELADATALQALANGVADAHQQKRALDWIIQQACGTYDMPYRPGNDGARNTDFALGKQFVGQQIVKLLKLQVGSLGRREPNADAHDPTA